MNKKLLLPFFHFFWLFCSSSASSSPTMLFCDLISFVAVCFDSFLFILCVSTTVLFFFFNICLLWGFGEGNGNPIFLPRKSHGQRSLTGYSPWGHKELDMTEPLNHHYEAFKIHLTVVTVYFKLMTTLITYKSSSFLLPPSIWHTLCYQFHKSFYIKSIH